MKILLLCPHPDDIELTMGGYLTRLLKNKNNHVAMVLFSDCGIFDEYQQAQKVLRMISNCNSYFFCEVREFEKKRKLILQYLYNAKVELNPDVVFCPSLSDSHQDHKVIAEEAYRAFKNTTLISYIHPQNCREIRPNYFIELTDDELNEKINLLSVYKSQQKRNYFSKEAIVGTAAFYGTMTNRKYCEAFEILRKFD